MIFFSISSFVRRNVNESFRIGKWLIFFSNSARPRNKERKTNKDFDALIFIYYLLSSSRCSVDTRLSLSILTWPKGQSGSGALARSSYKFRARFSFSFSILIETRGRHRKNSYKKWTRTILEHDLFVFHDRLEVLVLFSLGLGRRFLGLLFSVLWELLSPIVN